MVQPKGGRGKKVPYKQTHVRVPLPIIEPVKRIIDGYRASVISGNNPEELNALSCIDIDLCIKLVNRFIKQEKISEDSLNKPTRNNQNLKRFIDWLNQQKQ